MKNQKLCDTQTMWQLYCNSPEAIPVSRIQKRIEG